MIGDRQLFFYKVTYVSHKTIDGETYHDTASFRIKTEIPEDQMTTELADIITRATHDLSTVPVIKTGYEISPEDRPVAVELDNEPVQTVSDACSVSDVFHKVRVMLKYRGGEYAYYIDPRRFEDDTVDVAFVQANDNNGEPAIIMVTIPSIIAEHDASGNNVRALLQQIMLDFLDITAVDVKRYSDGRIITTAKAVPASFEAARKGLFPDVLPDARPNINQISWNDILSLPQSFLDMYRVRVKRVAVDRVMPDHLNGSAFLREHELVGNSK